MTLRVLHLVKTAVGATWAVRQMRELVKLGVEVHVAVPPGGPRIADYQAAGVVVHPAQFDLAVRRPWFLPRQARQLRDLVAAIKPDLIHSHFVGTTLTARLALGKSHPVRRIFQVPGPLHLENAFFRYAEIMLAGQADYWIGSCEWTCELYRQQQIAASRIFLSYYGTDLDLFVNRPPGKLRRELSLSPSVKIVGMAAYLYAPKRYLGQTRGLKGHEDLIEAIALCRQRDPSIVGVFIGGAWNNAAAYEARVRAYGHERCGESIFFLGTRPDVPELYPDFDVAVHPSLSENVGGAVESLLLAVPTIATCVGGFPDVIKPGETGWLVPPHCPERLADALQAALSDRGQAQQLAQHGQMLVRRLFDVRTTARQVNEIYQQVLDAPRN
jgi:glycosyltransferase involved in cell wall biosynthesis